MAFGMEMRGVPKPERDKAVAAVAKTLQIEHLLARRPSQLSGGQRQRVAMGRALVRQPRVFLFDEPLSNLDAKLRVDMRIEIKRLHQRTGTTIVYVTHDQIEAMTLATRIAVLKDGELQQVGTPERNLQFAGQSVRRRFHGLAGDEPAGGQGRQGQWRRIDRDRARPDPSRSCCRARERRRRQAGRRREGHFRHPAGGGQRRRERRPQFARAVAKFDAQVEIVEPAGSDTFVVTTIAGKEVTARMRADADVRVGQSHAFAFNLDKAVLFDPATTRRI